VAPSDPGKDASGKDQDRASLTARDKVESFSRRLHPSLAPGGATLFGIGLFLLGTLAGAFRTTIRPFVRGGTFGADAVAALLLLLGLGTFVFGLVTLLSDAPHIISTLGLPFSV
jgi:hypothetical protein